ncbi:MAG: sensor histidine kinase [Thermodesulfobacteriota bacterium]
MEGEQWEDAYLAQSQDAAIGRLFRGIVHNLNGVVQVFSLHAELLGMTMDKAMARLAEMEAGPAGAEAAGVLGILRQRAAGLSQLQDKVEEARMLLERTLVLPDLRKASQIENETLKQLVETEIAFLCADSFFKHRVERRLELAAGDQPLIGQQAGLHQIVQLLLDNALDAVRDEVESPRVEVSLEQGGDVLLLRIEDNGPGISPEVQARMCEPFFSTREGHAGLGLHLARSLAARFGARIDCESEPGRTVFVLTIPRQAVLA